MLGLNHLDNLLSSSTVESVWADSWSDFPVVMHAVVCGEIKVLLEMNVAGFVRFVGRKLSTGTHTIKANIRTKRISIVRCSSASFSILQLDTIIASLNYNFPLPAPCRWQYLFLLEMQVQPSAISSYSILPLDIKPAFTSSLS